MQLFYTSDIRGNLAHLSETESRHCIQVLRHQQGDRLHFVDGRGGFYEGEIIEAHKKNCVLSILYHTPSYKVKPFRLHIGIAPTKSIDRFEWFLEKATEIGIHEITPLLCKHSERKRIRLDRLEKVLLSAMKQSLQATLPKLNELTDFRKFLDTQHSSTDQKFIAHCQSDKMSAQKENYQDGQNVTILIGPEGDFQSTEIEWAQQQQFKAISLGSSRLRTETAGIIACHSVNFINEYA